MLPIVKPNQLSESALRYPSNAEFETMADQIEDKISIDEILDQLTNSPKGSEPIYQKIHAAVEPYIDRLPKPLQNPIRFGWKLMLGGNKTKAVTGWVNKYPQAMDRFFYNVFGKPIGEVDLSEPYKDSYFQIRRIGNVDKEIMIETPAGDLTLQSPKYKGQPYRYRFSVEASRWLLYAYIESLAKTESVTEALSSRDQKKLDKIYGRGTVVLEGKDTATDRSIRLYSVMESRGAQTNFELKEFFYLVGYEGKRVSMVESVTRGFQGRTNRDMYEYWNDAFLILVEDQAALDRWLAKSK